jgi:hypothetical protein
MKTRTPKSPWYTKARHHQEAWKASTPTIPDSARAPGLTMVDSPGGPIEVGPFPICLPLEHASLVLLPSIRGEALERFARHGIHWHAGTPGADGVDLPSTHLLDSQTQCVNVMLSLAAEPSRLLGLLQQVEPTATLAVPVEDGSCVAFEWSGAEDYLGESRGRSRQRGRFATSSDALCVVERSDGGRTAILIEWKFTESYSEAVKFHGGRTDRREVYRKAYEGETSPFAERPSIDVYFHEPHYQLMRQALLAKAMVDAGEFGIDRAILFHAVPAGNTTLLSTLTDGLKEYGDTIGEVWRRLLPGPAVRYELVDTAPLFGATAELEERYGGLR